MTQFVNFQGILITIILSTTSETVKIQIFPSKNSFSVCRISLLDYLLSTSHKTHNNNTRVLKL